MSLEINYLAVLVCAVLAMALGSIWYGPLFGKTFMKAHGMDRMTEAEKKKMQKESMPLYAIQFVLVLFQIYVLAHYIAGWEEAGGVENALWIWAAFVMPTIAGGVMWSTDAKKIIWTKFLLSAGYQLVLFVMFGVILGAWR